MKIYAIRNRDEKGTILGYVLYYEKTNVFNIELIENINENKLPLILDIFYHKKIYSINSYYSEKFLSMRVVPPDRQNIALILKNLRTKIDCIKTF